MQQDYAVVVVTTDSKESAKMLAKILLEKHLAASVQLFPIESLYWWEGAVHDEHETVLLIKSKTALFGEIKATIKENHDYQVPEILQLPILDGLPEYLDWIGENTKRADENFD